MMTLSTLRYRTPGLREEGLGAWTSGSEGAGAGGLKSWSEGPHRQAQFPSHALPCPCLPGRNPSASCSGSHQSEPFLQSRLEPGLHFW